MADREVIYDGRIVKLGIETATLPDGRTARLEIVRHPGAAAVVAVDAEDRVVLIRQHRHAAGGLILEVPAGVLEPGETPAACAARELTEETGLVAGAIEPLGFVLTTPGFTDERIWIFSARDLRSAERNLDPDEYIEVLRVPAAEALAMTRDGRIADAKTIAALHRALCPRR